MRKLFLGSALLAVFFALHCSVAQAQSDVIFNCGVPSPSCTGTVANSGPNYSTTGISVFNTQGPYISPADAFTLVFNTLAGTITIDGTGTWAGQDLTGHITTFLNTPSGTNSILTLAVVWPTLPLDVQTWLGTTEGLDSVAIFYHNTGLGAYIGGVTVSPTPEPASMLLMGTGLLAFGGFLRRKRSQHA